MSSFDGIETGAVFANVYRVERRLSEGGMGAVYVVRHTELGDLRALKVMHPHVGADERMRKKFAQEARIGSLIRSEHVVRVLDVGIEASSGRPWLAMELLDGCDLRTFIDKHGPHTRDVIRRILDQLQHALGAAHRAGVVHRDLKPENIFVARSERVDQSYVVKILDFGISKIVAEARTDMSMMIGSPLWMAPEQAQLGEEVGPPTDVWAVGLIAFYLLTGKSFWLAGNAQNATPAHVLNEVLIAPIPAASERAAALRVSPDALPPGFDAWFAACVNRTYSARFREGGSALARLAELLGGGATPAISTSPLARTSMPSGPALAPVVAPGRLAPMTILSDATSDSAPGQTPMRTGGSTTAAAYTSAPLRPKARGGVVLFGVVASMLVAAGVLTFVLRDKLFGGETRSRASAAASQPAKEPAQSSPTASADVDVAVLPHAIASAEAAPAASVASAEVRPATSTAPKTVVTSRPVPTVVRPAVNCDPPFTIDASGIRRAKPECL